MAQKVSIQRLLPLLILIRCLQAVWTRTFFQADEFWQSLEPAHYMAFGYGDLTWEWKFGLRSYAYPFIFQLGYVAVKCFASFCSLILQIAVDWFSLFVAYVVPEYDIGWEMLNEMQSFPSDTKEFIEYWGVIYAPKITMGILAGVGEYYTILLVRKLYRMTLNKDDDNKKFYGKESKIINLALVLSVSNFFNCFILTRTFVNSFEMIMTSIALYYWDWTCGNNINSHDFMKSLIIATFTTLQRPTNGLIWIILGAFLVTALLRRRDASSLVNLVKRLSVAAFLSTTVNMLIDLYFYGHWTIPVLKFIKFNATSSLSKFYGVAPWHFHIFQSVPLIAGYALPLLIHSFFCPFSSRKFDEGYNPLDQVKVVVMVNIIMYSLISHKEFRFIYPLQPFFIVLTSMDANVLLDRCANKFGKQHTKRMQLILNCLWGLPVLSLVLSLILSTFHESGVVSVIDYLHNAKRIDSVGFIMPCHSTPWQSHLHRNDISDMWYITCSPPLHLLGDPESGIKVASYMDESDYLYDNPEKFIYQNFPPPFRKDLRSPGKEYLHEWPEYLVIFEELDSVLMKDYLSDSSYVEEARFFNTLVHWDSRRSGDVIVYHKIPWM